MRDIVGNLPPLPGVYPDYAAPIVRTATDGMRELAMARWGMPSPAFALQGKKTDPGVTNVRNTASPARSSLPCLAWPRTWGALPR
jgi:putative SOS response-associated peptidase YedK